MKSNGNLPTARMKFAPLPDAQDSGFYFSRPPLFFDHRHHCSTLQRPPKIDVSLSRHASSSPTSSHSPTSLIGKPSAWTAHLNPPRFDSHSPFSSSARGGGIMATTLGAGFGRVARMRCHHSASYTTVPTAHGSRLLRARPRCLPQNSTETCGRKTFSSSTGGGGKRPRFSQRLGEALRNSKVTWYQIPVGVGIGFLGLIQFYKVSSREKEKQLQQEEEGGRPQKRPRIRPDGPWYVWDVDTLAVHQLT